MTAAFHRLLDEAPRAEQFAGRLCVELAELGIYVPLAEMGEAAMRTAEFMRSHNERGEQIG